MDAGALRKHHGHRESAHNHLVHVGTPLLNVREVRAAGSGQKRLNATARASDSQNTQVCNLLLHCWRLGSVRGPPRGTQGDVGGGDSDGDSVERRVLVRGIPVRVELNSLPTTSLACLEPVSTCCFRFHLLGGARGASRGTLRGVGGDNGDGKSVGRRIATDACVARAVGAEPLDVKSGDDSRLARGLHLRRHRL